jgi:hypothetical protein
LQENPKFLMELLAIPLGHQKTVTKWLATSQTRRTKIIAAPHTWGYVSKIIFVQQRVATVFWILGKKNAPSQRGRLGAKSQQS